MRLLSSWYRYDLLSDLELEKLLEHITEIDAGKAEARLEEQRQLEEEEEEWEEQEALAEWIQTAGEEMVQLVSISFQYFSRFMVNWKKILDIVDNPQELEPEAVYQIVSVNF